MAGTPRRTGLVLLLALVCALFLFPAQGRAADGKTYVFKMATLAPKGVGWARQFENIMMPKVEEMAKGHLKFKAYWGGIMGDDEDMVKKMRVGQLDCAGISCQGANMICPEMNALQLPFLFE
ncbi:MAG: TRAP transporter substrate-binding protein DctP, partial [Deltaproteobacteria bacterium]|nr:TRAP transporter substrate-binding protein DctP [Deltaproteobacteria bacterium]